MSQLGHLCERVSAFVGIPPLAAGTTTAGSGHTIVDLQSANADSVMALAMSGTVVGAGVSFTLQGSATTANFANLCTSGTTVVITVATTVSNRILIADAKCVPFRYVQAISNTTTATPLSVALIAYDSKSQPTAPSTAIVAVTVKAVAPTTTA